MGSLSKVLGGDLETSDPPCNKGRRAAIFSITSSSVSFLTTIFGEPLAGEALEGTGANSTGLVSTYQISDRLRNVPTFTLVDPKGAPFMVVGEDAKVTGYFFTDYYEAKRILDIARKSATQAIAEAKKDPRQSGEVFVNPWINARISSVPLDFAITVVSRSKKGAYFQIAASAGNIEDALALTGKDDLAEGKVPVFYIEDFKLKGTEKIPLYFNQRQLEEAYRAAGKGGSSPEIKVSELFAVILEMVRPDFGREPELENLVFVPPTDSLKRRKDCEKSGGKESPFLIGERIVVL